LTDRDQLLQEMQVAGERVREAIDGLTEEQASRREIDGWSVKDHLTHMTYWHEMRFFEVSRIARGGRASFPASAEADVEQINEQFVINRRPLTWQQAVADLEFARDMVRQAISASPEDRLNEGLYDEIGMHGAGHDTEHAEIIESWRKKAGV
jgi:hypothetical protein